MNGQTTCTEDELIFSPMNLDKIINSIISKPSLINTCLIKKKLLLHNKIFIKNIFETLFNLNDATNIKTPYGYQIIMSNKHLQTIPTLMNYIKKNDNKYGIGVYLNENNIIEPIKYVDFNMFYKDYKSHSKINLIGGADSSYYYLKYIDKADTLNEGFDYIYNMSEVMSNYILPSNILKIIGNNDFLKKN